MATPQRRTQRTSTACDFCRKRKLGCDNARPKCENCQGRAVECTYSTRTTPARPSNARIQKLEEENARLRRQLQSHSPEVRSIGHSDTLPLADAERNTKQSKQIPSIVAVISQANALPQQIHTNVVSLAYPPTTTGQPEDHVFHGPSGGTVDSSVSKNSGRAADFVDQSAVKDQLLAEATRQRQLENINLRSGKLNFGEVDPKTGMELFSNFWNRQHYIGSVVYRPAFMRDMAYHGPYFSELLLNAILFSGSKYTAVSATLWETNDLNSIGRPFRVKFEQILHDSGSQILLKSEITTIQALLVVADALFSWCNERSLSWHYMGIAINMIVDLGLHIDVPAQKPPGKGSAEDTEIARRLFWAAFTLDKVQSIYQGRPTRLRGHDNSVPIRFLDELEELEDFNTHTYSAQPKRLDYPTYSVSTFGQLCKLSSIIDRVLCALYTERSPSRSADELWENAGVLHSELKFWKDDMPKHLRVHQDDPTNSAILPHTLSLMALYNSLIILVYRPFLSEGHLTSVSATAAPEAFSNCAKAALEIHQVLQLYKQHFCLKMAPYFISYATYVSGTIHVRMAAQKGSGSQAHTCLRTCLEVLSIQQTWCHAPKRTMKILLGIMRRLGVHVGDFVAIEPAGCGTTETHDITLSQRGLASTDSMSQVPVTPSLQQRPPVSDINMSKDFPVDPDLELTDFDIEQFMQSFIVEASGASQQAPMVFQHEDPQFGFTNYGMGDQQVTDQDMMVFDSLFGVDYDV